jgi:hypothetical protein
MRSSEEEPITSDEMGRPSVKSWQGAGSISRSVEMGARESGKSWGAETGVRDGSGVFRG